MTLKDTRGYSHLKEEALYRTMWGNRFRGGFGPVVRQNTEWMSGNSIVTEHVFVSLQCSNVGILFWRIVWVTTRCCFKSDVLLLLMALRGNFVLWYFIQTRWIYSAATFVAASVRAVCERATSDSGHEFKTWRLVIGCHVVMHFSYFPRRCLTLG